MTTRYWGVLVTFEEPMREDDYEESIAPALRMMRLVKGVQPIEGDPLVEQFVRMARDEEWDKRLRELIHEMRFG